MIHVVNHSNRHLYPRQIREMNVGRLRSSAGRDGWRDLTVFEGAEPDEFDDERAVYLMALSEDGRLQGASRVRTTEDGSILFDRNPHLIAPGQPNLKGSQTWEGGPVFATDAFRRSSHPGQRGFPGLDLAGREVALDHGARYLIGMMDVRALGGMTPSGPPEVRILGLPAAFGPGVMVGACVELSAAGNERMRDALAEPMRLSYEVTDDDVDMYGSVTAVQHAVEAARWASRQDALKSLRDPKRAIVQATALFMIHDALIADLLQRWTGV